MPACTNVSELSKFHRNIALLISDRIVPNLRSFNEASLQKGCAFYSRANSRVARRCSAFVLGFACDSLYRLVRNCDICSIRGTHGDVEAVEWRALVFTCCTHVKSIRRVHVRPGSVSGLRNLQTEGLARGSFIVHSVNMYSSCLTFR